MFKKDQLVRQKVTPIEGIVESFQVDQATGELQISVGWETEDGWHSRFFKESELEAVAAPVTVE